MENEPDRELLAAARDGDERAFDVFYRRHAEVLLAFCAQRTRNPETAADLMMETFTVMLLHVHDPERALPDTPLAWLFTVAKRKIIDSYRKATVESGARRRLELEPIVLDDEDIAAINEIAGNTDVALELARQLPPEQFEVIKARVFEELQFPDIARELGVSEQVVRKRLSRGLKALRHAMGGDAA